MVLNLSKQRAFPFLKWRLGYMCVRIGDMMKRVNVFFNFQVIYHSLNYVIIYAVSYRISRLKQDKTGVRIWYTETLYSVHTFSINLKLFQNKFYLKIKIPTLRNNLLILPFTCILQGSLKKYSSRVSPQNNTQGSGQMAQRFTTVTILIEDPGLTPSPHMVILL